MKRIGFLYEKICDMSNIQMAITMSAKHKHKKRAVRRVLANRDYYANELHRMLVEQKIEWGEDKYKVIVEPSSKKERDITVPTYFPDQVVHWCIMLVIEKYIRKGMCYSCIGSVPGRGPMYGMRKLRSFFKRNKSAKYIYKADIYHFFKSVNIPELKSQLTHTFKDKKLLSLLFYILDKGCRGTGVGLPIGYYTSQWLSNFCLQRFDHSILESKKPVKYYRYVDDIVVIAKDKKALHQLHNEAVAELRDIGLGVKGNWQVFRRGSRPLDFLGYKFYEGFVLLRKRIFIHLNALVRAFKKGLKNLLKLARGILSLFGYLFSIDNGFKYYLSHIKQEVAKSKLTKMVSQADKKIGGMIYAK